MPSEPVVHVIDDDEAVRDSLAFLLRIGGHRRSDATRSAAAFLRGGVPTRHRLHHHRRADAGDERHRAAAAPASELDVGLPVIVITGHGDVPLAVEAMKLGAVDFLEKPFDDDVLLAAVAHRAGTRARQMPRRERRTGGDRRAGSPRCRTASGRCSTAWSPAIPTR